MPEESPWTEEPGGLQSRHHKESKLAEWLSTALACIVITTITIEVLTESAPCIYLFLAALGLPCFAGAFSSLIEQGLLFIEVLRLLIAVVSLVAEHRL